MPLLDPAHLRSPRNRSLIRYAVVAGLLALAAGALAVDPSRPVGCRGTTTPATTPVPGTTPRAVRTPTSAPAAGTTGALPPGTVGVPVRLAEPGTAAVLHPGDRVDVIARTASPEDTVSQDMVLAHDVLVVSSSEDGIVYLAMSPQQAPRVSRMAPDVAVGVTVRPD